MLRKPFLLFLIVMAILVSGALSFVQSRNFSQMLSRAVQNVLPTRFGLEGSFEEISIELLPPGLALVRPTLAVNQDQNPLDLPAGSSLKAERLRVLFQPLQALSGEVRISRVAIEDGQIIFARRAESKKTSKHATRLGWEDLLQVKVDGFELSRIHVSIDLPNPELKATFQAERARVTPWKQGGKAAYQVDLALEGIHAEGKGLHGLPREILALSTVAYLNPSGLTFESLSSSMSGVEFQARGLVKGDVLSSNPLQVEGELTVQADLSKMARALPGLDRIEKDLSGQTEFVGRLKGDINQRNNPIRLDGRLRGSSVRFMDWEFDTIDVESVVSTQGEAAVVDLKKAILSSTPRPRIAERSQGAKGGTIEIGATRIDLQDLSDIRLPVRLIDAHLHWLSAPALADVFMLDSAVSGELNVTLSPGSKTKPWRLSADVDLETNLFQLDNQKIGQKRSLNRILAVPSIGVEGSVDIDQRGLRTRNLAVTSGKVTRFVGGGEITFKGPGRPKPVYDLKFEGVSDLGELGPLAESEIKGVGSVKTQVVGPSNRIVLHFDTDIRDGEYLNLNLGNFKGRVTYDDGPTELRFTDVALNQGLSFYRFGGRIDLLKDQIYLDADFDRGDVRDLSKIFERLTSDFWWYPRTLSGEVVGKARVRGGLSLSTLRVDSEWQGQSWSYLGERFPSVKLKGGYDSGKYFISSSDFSKRGGKIEGRIAYSAREGFDWRFRSQNLQLNDLDLIARLDVPIRGALNLESQGVGLDGEIDATTNVSVDNFAIRGTPMAGSSLNVSSRSGLTRAQVRGFGEQVTLALDYGFRAGTPSHLKFKANGFDFSSFLLLLNSTSLQDPKLRGVLSAAADLKFPSGGFEFSTGKVEITEYSFSRSGSSLTLERPVKFELDSGSTSSKSFALRGEQGLLNVELASNRANLSGRVFGEVDLSLAEFFTTSVTRVSSLAKINGRIDGTVKKPVLELTGVVRGGSAQFRPLEASLENVQAEGALKNGVLSISRFESDLGGGRVSGRGVIEFFNDRLPRLDLSANLTGNRIRVFPFQSLRVRGKVSLAGSEFPYVIGGKVIADSGLIREKVMGNKAVGAVGGYAPAAVYRLEGDLPRFQLDLEGESPGGIMVKNDLFDAEVKGKIKIVNTLEAPRVLGSAEVVRGALTFKDRVFQIQSAGIKFDNPAVINPVFDMAATTDVGGVKVSLFSAGRMDKFKVDLSSNPVLPEQEILSLLALGISPDDPRRQRATDRSTVEQTEAASLVLHSLDFNRDVQERTGLQIQLDEASSTSAGASAFRPRADESTAAPKIVIRRRLGRRWNLSVGSTVGVGTNSQKEVSAEYQVTPGFSILGVWDTLEAADKLDSRTSFGLDLKIQKRFR